MNPIRLRHSLIALTAALALLASLAGPAAANATGVITAGTATVGKNVTFCNHDGVSDVSGAGIGMPVINPEPKQAFYALRDVVVTVINDVTKGVKTGVSIGVLNMCGRLRWIGKVSSGTAIGAACGMTKGYHGKGRIIYFDGPKAVAGFPHNTYSLHNITWKADVAGTITFWASGSQGILNKGAKGPDLVTGTVNAQGGVPCLSKTGEGPFKTGGATQWFMTGGFEVINGAWSDPQSPGIGTLESPGICKNTGNPLCAYDTKKPQTPKQDG